MRNIDGAELHRLRKRKGATVYDVANAIGVTAPAISLWESGQRRISAPMSTLLRLYFAGRLEGTPARRATSTRKKRT